MAATNDTSFPERNRGWYQEDLIKVNAPIHKLLENYSHVPSSEVVKHVNDIASVYYSDSIHRDPLITSTTKSDLILVRLRHIKEASQDFILILEFKEQDTCVEAHHRAMVCPRDTSLKAIAEKLDLIIQNTSGNKSASNGLLNLQLALEPISGRPMFTIKPKAMLRPPDVTFDASAELQKSYLMAVIERILQAQGRGEDLRNIDYCEKGYELKSIYGQPPLVWASKKGNTEIVKLFLDNGIDIGALKNGKRMPLVVASDEGHVEVVRLLLATRNIDVNSKDSESS